MPADCYSLKNSKVHGKITDVVEVIGHHWLDASCGVSLGEQTVAQAKGYRMTLLTVESEEEKDEWEAPRFKR